MKHNRALFATLITLALLVRVQAQDPLTNGLVAFYPFNGNTSDASGNGNDGAFAGTNWAFLADRFGQPTNSLFLNTPGPFPANTTGTYVAVPKSASLDFNQDFTLSVWTVIPNGLPSGGLPGYWVHNLISDGSDASSPNLRLLSSVNPAGQDYLQFIANNGGDLVDIHANVSPLRGLWWQATVVRSGTNLSLFRDGVIVANSAVTATMMNNPNMEIGSMGSCGSPCPSTLYHS